ncbi:MAG: response regulator transcription factor [Eubacterium sp.]|nr:response regulator transcription factor [Eubacterium sp.]
MKLQIVVTDDLESDREQIIHGIKTHLKGTGFTPTIKSYNNCESMLEEFVPGKYQIAFLDICMEGMNGIELARQLRELDTEILLVFTTTSREFAFDAFPVHPFDYMIKPYSSERLNAVLDEALRVLNADVADITLRVAHRTYQVPLRTIVSAVSQGHNVEIRTIKGQLLKCRMTFTEVSDLLKDDSRFLPCNRGVLINMDHVLGLDKDEVRMNDGTRFALRIRKRSELVHQFSQYQLSRVRKGVTS